MKKLELCVTVIVFGRPPRLQFRMEMVYVVGALLVGEVVVLVNDKTEIL
jgi:hypothetical protein